MGTTRGNKKGGMAIAKTYEIWNPVRERRSHFTLVLAQLACFTLCLGAGPPQPLKRVGVYSLLPSSSFGLEVKLARCQATRIQYSWH